MQSDYWWRQLARTHALFLIGINKTKTRKQWSWPSTTSKWEGLASCLDGGWEGWGRAEGFRVFKVRIMNKIHKLPVNIIFSTITKNLPEQQICCCPVVKLFLIALNINDKRRGCSLVVTTTGKNCKGNKAFSSHTEHSFHFERGCKTGCLVSLWWFSETQKVMHTLPLR